MIARELAVATEPKSKSQRESSRRPGPGVRSTLGVTKPTRSPTLASTQKSSLKPATAGCATRRYMTGWGEEPHLRPVAAGR